MRFAENFTKVTFIFESAPGSGFLDRAAFHLQNADRGFQAQLGKELRWRHSIQLMENPGKMITAVSCRPGDVVHIDVIRKMFGTEIQNCPNERLVTRAPWCRIKKETFMQHHNKLIRHGGSPERGADSGIFKFCKNGIDVIQQWGIGIQMNDGAVGCFRLTHQSHVFHSEYGKI